MARIPQNDIERLKEEVSVARLVESAGVELKKSGKDLAGRCPFHEDDTASLIVTPAKNLWHCFGCQIGGGPIDWVMKARGVSFRHAVELLKADPSLAAASSAAPVKRSTVRALPAPVAFDADDQVLLNQTIDYYHERLQATAEAAAYLASRGLVHPELVSTFRLGVADRTLGLRLPEKNRKDGAAVRARLQKVGLLRESGHEHFNGSLVVPIFDERGNVVEVYGRKLLDNLRAGTPKHLYLPAEKRSGGRGVFNRAALASREVILCESIIDALTFWCAGFRNVTTAYGVEGFTDELLTAFKTHSTERVLIAYDRDEPGERAAEKLAERLMSEGIACFRVQFPKGMDANEYALKVQPASKSLGLLIRKAVWLGNGKPPAREAIEAEVFEIADCDLKDAPPVLPLAADTAPEAAPVLAPQHASPLPEAAREDVPVSHTDAELVLVFGDRRYRVRGWKKPANPETLKVNVLVSRDNDESGRFHVDTLDLYQAKARAAFVKLAGIEIGESEDVLKNDLGRVLLKLEAAQAELLTATLTKADKVPQLSDAEQAEALALLKSPDLIARITSDFTALGVVGESTNCLVGYLAAVSRQLDKPLAVIIQSSSAAGKSSLMDAVLSLMPEEAQVRYSAMSGQSLFYMGQTNLKHKILAIDEEDGASRASYALKLLQRDRQVTMASTGKDAATGLLTTHEYKVEGPVMLMLTTTAIDIDEELLNRCLVLTVNESREQTRAIHVIQRQRQTLEGLLADASRADIVTLHRNAQRLLQPLAVVNPFADRLTFLDDKTRTRRDHMKYLSLIRAVAFLHQYQRPIRSVQHKDRWLRYIEVTEQDIRIANRLAHEVLGRTLDELPPQTRKLLTHLHAWVSEQCAAHHVTREDFRFTRREVRALTGWGDTQLKVHLGRLADLEYLLVHRLPRGGFAYELRYDGEGDSGQRFLMGLHDYDGERSGVKASQSGVHEPRSGLGRPSVGGQSVAGRVETMPGEPSAERLSGHASSLVAETHVYHGGAAHPVVLMAKA